MIVVKNKNFTPQTTNRAWNVNPFNAFFNQDFEHLFGSDIQSQTPHVNIVESETGFTIEVAAPGLNKEDLKIDLNKNVLTVSAEKKTETETKKPNYLKREFSYNRFKRSFNMGENVDTTGIKAGYENGILKVELPKKEKNNDDAIKTIAIS